MDKLASYELEEAKREARWLMPGAVGVAIGLFLGAWGWLIGAEFVLWGAMLITAIALWVAVQAERARTKARRIEALAD